MKRLLWITLLLLAPLAQGADRGFDHSHALFGDVLAAHVTWQDDGTASTVDYAALKQDAATLQRYLDQLSTVPADDFDAWQAEQQLAFLINAYNAFTLKLILDNSPLASIRNIGRFWENPWKMRFFELLGESMHLDQVEHEIIREPGRYDEPRIHFAVNCASVGCPALRDEPYVAERLDAQLEDATARFLRDRTRNRWEADRERLAVSSIFRWYSEDFDKAAGSLNKWLAGYAVLFSDDEAVQAQLRRGDFSVRYLDYDWSLNE